MVPNAHTFAPGEVSRRPGGTNLHPIRPKAPLIEPAVSQTDSRFSLSTAPILPNTGRTGFGAFTGSFFGLDFGRVVWPLDERES